MYCIKTTNSDQSLPPWLQSYRVMLTQMVLGASSWQFDSVYLLIVVSLFSSSHTLITARKYALLHSLYFSFACWFGLLCGRPVHTTGDCCYQSTFHPIRHSAISLSFFRPIRVVRCNVPWCWKHLTGSSPYPSSYVLFYDVKIDVLRYQQRSNPNPLCFLRQRTRLSAPAAS